MREERLQGLSGCSVVPTRFQSSQQLQDVSRHKVRVCPEPAEAKGAVLQGLPDPSLQTLVIHGGPRAPSLLTPWLYLQAF